MPDGLDLAGQVVLALLDERLGHRRDFGDRPVQPQRRVDVVREQVAGDAAAGDGDVEAPQAFAALRQVGRDRPVLQELRAVVEDASELALVDELLDHRDGGHAAVVVPDGVRHAGLLDRVGHRLPLPVAVRPSGFSHITILPAFAAAIAMSWCVSFGLAMSMTSMSFRLDQIAPVGRVRLVAPVGGELLHALFIARRHRLQHRPPRQIEEPRRLQKRIRVGPSHEPVADQSDIRDPSSPLVPPMRVTDRRHDAEHVVPGFLLHHDGVGEHAAVPADVPEIAGRACPLSSRSQ